MNVITLFYLEEQVREKNRMESLLIQIENLIIDIIMIFLILNT